MVSHKNLVVGFIIFIEKRLSSYHILNEFVVNFSLFIFSSSVAALANCGGTIHKSIRWYKKLRNENTETSFLPVNKDTFCSMSERIEILSSAMSSNVVDIFNLLICDADKT